MKTVIIEDEVLSAKRLKRLLEETGEQVEVLATLGGVRSAIMWFKTNPPPDLVFMDIQLSDGLSFEIFESVEVTCPVVFTTAFDEYAVRAFKVNSVDYLLKPIRRQDLEQSLKKFNALFGESKSHDELANFREVLQKISLKQPVYRSRFLLKKGETFHKVKSEEIAYFFLENKITFLMLYNGKKFISDLPLEELESSLNPDVFFRVSRQCIVNVNCIESIHLFPGGSLKLKVQPPPEEAIIVSRRRAAAFKEWMDK